MIIAKFPTLAPGAGLWWRENGALFFGIVDSVGVYSVTIRNMSPGLRPTCRVFPSMIDRVEEVRS